MRNSGGKGLSNNAESVKAKAGAMQAARNSGESRRGSGILSAHASALPGWREDRAQGHILVAFEESLLVEGDSGVDAMGKLGARPSAGANPR